jgi:hypothetical protein
MKLKALVVGVLLTVPVLGAAGPAQACGGSPACDLINRVCDKVVGPCIP